MMSKKREITEQYKHIQKEGIEKIQLVKENWQEPWK